MSIQDPENWQSLVYGRNLAKAIRASGFPCDRRDLEEVVGHTKAEWDLLGTALGNSTHSFRDGTITFAFNGERFQGIVEEDGGATYLVWPDGGLRPPNLLRRIAALGEVAMIFAKDLIKGDRGDTYDNFGMDRVPRRVIASRERPLSLPQDRKR
jgi:hypothetical protein